MKQRIISAIVLLAIFIISTNVPIPQRPNVNKYNKPVPTLPK